MTQFDGMNINNLGATGRDRHSSSAPPRCRSGSSRPAAGSAESNAGDQHRHERRSRRRGATRSRFRVNGALFQQRAPGRQPDGRPPRARADDRSQVKYLYDTNFERGRSHQAGQDLVLHGAPRAGERDSAAGHVLQRARRARRSTRRIHRGPRTARTFSSRHAARVTWQINSKNKLNGYAEPQKNCVCRARGEFVAPEAAYRWDFWPTGLYQATWNGTMTSRLLFEAAVGAAIFDWPNYLQPETGNAISIPIGRPGSSTVRRRDSRRRRRAPDPRPGTRSAPP